MKTSGNHFNENRIDPLEREPLVSIVMPFFNAERFMDEAVASVFSQTHHRWELLLINDGSTDASPEIARRYAAEHPSKVQYLEHPGHEHHGTATTRNLGLAHAKGAYFAFLDADDVWLPNKLQEQIAVLASEPDAAGICGASLYWYSWTGKTEDLKKDRLVQVRAGAAPCQEIDLSMLSVRESWSTPPPSCLLVRRDVVESIGRFQDGFINAYEDLAFFLKLGLRSKILASQECWCKYRQHPDAVCAVARRTGTHSAGKVRFLEWASQYLEGCPRSDLREAVKEELGAELSQGRPPAVLRRVARRVLGRVPGVKSAWHLGRALHESWLDSSARAVPAIQTDFSHTDPWHYSTNELEMLRHRREAEMLDRVRGSRRFGRALELGCAEGLFTQILSSRCDSLLATDISEIALARAQQRCYWDPHVTFETLDLRVDPLRDGFDLIVAIHVLEYIKNPLTLRRVRDELVAALRRGGYLLIGSCTGDTDFREKLWWSRYLLRGGQRINCFIAAHPELSIVDCATHPLPGSTSYDLLLRKRT